MNNEEKHVRMDGNHDNDDEIFVDSNDFNVSEDSPRKVDSNDNFSVVDDNDVELSMDEPYSQNVANDNDVECGWIVSANTSSIRCGTLVRTDRWLTGDKV
ncbi:Hypothetical predicted protein [Olea europaea subsp. europaea]|uniref:Uncharacterized protein n=1 Tax=Olea europaea subsp. europaea TaxID=158383 RepID=A0A8S0RLG8_OLEEU|nr:Hypothetical predicted protein [Olea europaea subsp. europaea]